MSKKKKDWRVEKERLLALGLEERRKEYGERYVPLEEIPTWKQQEKSKYKDDVEDSSVQTPSLSDKVSLYKGDITVLEIDAIVNAANASLLGGGGVDGCIHRAAGSCLFDECHTLNGCGTGKAKITCGYDLPAKYIIHTVGPIARGHVGKTQNELLANCYENSLKLLLENGLRSVAFPCISTGIYGFPNEPAAEIALETVRNWIKTNTNEIDRVIFCVFLEMDYKIYKEKLSKFFSQENNMNEDAAEGMTEEEGKKCTPPNKTPKKKKLKKDEDINEEEDDDKTESADTEMESQKEPDKRDNTDAEMESQILDAVDNPASVEPKKGSDINSKEASDVNTNQDKPSKGHKHGDDPMENRGETEESKTDSDKDEVGSQLTEMETEAAVCQNKAMNETVVSDPNLDSKELSKGGSKPEHELMEDQGIAVSADAKPPVEKIENSETEEGLVEMNTQVEDSLETEATQPENNQSKDVAGDVKDP
ncbi:ADP-ribose glycohydrolase MACROD2-like isoform X2 [Acipenser ruthenus]|uniref:ADP-ribose glycohydrolase MACROD2-like isoform X2 n=1 Tax=Acipenser ruthenus TaxID=7906 RepID=UPI0015613996|nr:ADP-ribose glycohydrolase MACROD2-like isoform X2 [Acipenser ruthenus]